MIAIIGQNEAAVLQISLKIAPFIGIEFDQLMAGKITKRRRHHPIIGERNDMLLGIHAQRRVLQQSVRDVRWHALIDVPVTRLIHEPGEPEVIRAAVGIGPLLGRRRHRQYRYTASDRDVNVNSRSFIGGSIIKMGASWGCTRTGLPNSSTLLSMMTGDSLNRKFLIGYLISPFSM